jgi:hypothetical protein
MLNKPIGKITARYCHPRGLVRTANKSPGTGTGRYNPGVYGSTIGFQTGDPKARSVHPSVTPTRIAINPPGRPRGKVIPEA